jgi:predicted RNA-binding Zn-ribbon protein involved in translation (DUF1610 family)
MTKFVCKSCNYRFESEGEVKKACPYCGELEIINEPSAEDLLKE